MRSLSPLLVMLALVFVGGCGGGDNERDRVELYIKQANTVQRGFAKDFKLANDTYQAFARATLSPDAAVLRLREAALGIVHARTALADLDPPAEANALHSRLLRLFDMNEDFAVETLRLARYQRNSAKVLGPLRGVDDGLRSDLRRARQPLAQAAALRRFVSGVDTALAGLKGLQVPRVLRPPHGDQIRRLNRTRTLARRLDKALRDQDAPGVARLVKQFRANSARSGARRKLARLAIKDYERRYRQLSDAYGDLRRENSSLGQTLD